MLEEIMDAIGNGPARRFYFYFSGHGFAQLQTNSHLCLAKWSDKRRNNALDAKSYLNYILATGQFRRSHVFHGLLPHPGK